MTADETGLARLRSALDELGVEHAEGTREGELVVTLPGERKLRTVCSLVVGAEAVSVQAFVIRNPDENHERFYRFLLRRNLRMPGMAYAIDGTGDVYLGGRLPVGAISVESVDQLLGTVLTACDEPFNDLLVLGFLTSMKAEWRWRISRGESTRNLEAFRHLLEGSEEVPETSDHPPATDHDHAHGGSHDAASYFDEQAATWDDDPTKVERAGVVADLICEVVEPGPSSRVLDYGAGTGLLAQALAPHVGPLTVADPSAGMREVLTQKVGSGALPRGSRVWELDLAVEEPPEESFDLIVSLLVLHHVPDVAAALRGFAAMLAPGGRVAVCDLETEDGSFHDSSRLDVHHGFDADALSRLLTDAGFGDVEVRPAHTLTKEGRDYPLFLATATRLGR
ncbi:methyltransferase domain-containing protein [Ornithinimicrobium cryptoxanthini]|uniref:methyltransferase domain-containing protein n=1 Tax=Ornithinimicrobium cryptoxanthini TaxID=2934161 RepID=UPI002740FE7D|nr:methyltransferase domain-containing protein [Ornithinimicrobium cryptoxanthini]